MPEDDFDIDVDDLQRRMDGAMASLKKLNSRLCAQDAQVDPFLNR